MPVPTERDSPAMDEPSVKQEEEEVQAGEAGESRMESKSGAAEEQKGDGAAVLPDSESSSTSVKLEEQGHDGEDEKALLDAAQEEEEKEEDDDADASALSGEPLFAVICSFFNKFAALLGLQPLSFGRLEELLTKLDASGRVDKDLVDLHIRLLRRVQLKSAVHKKWEHWLLKFCQLVPQLHDEYVQLNRFGYIHSPISTKLSILKTLCDCQFDFNPKFKDGILGSFTSSDLRLLPVGYDQNGRAYWYQQDADLNVRIYTEEPDDLSGGTWQLKARSRDELDSLVRKLKESSSKDSATPPAPVLKDESSSSIKEEEQQETKAGTETAKDEQENDNVAEKEDGTTTLPVKLEQDDTTVEAKQGEKTLDPTEEVVKKNSGKQRGTCMDTYQQIKEPLKKKGSAGNKKQDTKQTTVEKLKAEEAERRTPSEERSGSDSQPEIPDELKPFIDRRILPRRNASLQALSKLKTLESSGTKRKCGVQTATKSPAKKGKCPVDQQKCAKGSEKKLEDIGGAAADSDQESSGSCSSSSAEVSDDDDEEEDSDEFVPLSELRRKSNGTAGRRKRRRTKLPKALSDSENSGDEGEGAADAKEQRERKKATVKTLCKKCEKSDHWEVLLLCDKCDDAWHTWCLRPQLWFVPDDDWFCPPCQHSMLVEKLGAALIALDEALTKKTLDDKKKQSSAARLKRELEYIGVSLNNIIPTKDESDEEESDQSDDDDDESDGGGRRKRKRKNNNGKRERRRSPIVPIAVGRSRRRQADVDYNFAVYDEQLQEAIDEINEAPAKPKYHDPARPQGGAGRGKDMANIIDAEQQRRKASGQLENGGRAASDENGGEKKGGLHHHRKLTDLDVDNMTESDTDEYEASDHSEVAASSEEYVPSDEDDDSEPKRRSARIRSQRRKSDDDFVVSGSDVEYRPKGEARGSRRKRKRRGSDDSEDSLVEEVKSRNKRGSRRKWAPKAASSDDDDSNESDPEYGARKKGTSRDKKSARVSNTGRPLRGARKQVSYSAMDGPSSYSDSESKSGSDDGDDADKARCNGRKKPEGRPVGALTRPKRARIGSSDEGEEGNENRAAKNDSGDDSHSEEEEDDDGSDHRDKQSKNDQPPRDGAEESGPETTKREVKKCSPRKKARRLESDEDEEGENSAEESAEHSKKLNSHSPPPSMVATDGSEPAAEGEKAPAKLPDETAKSVPSTSSGGSSGAETSVIAGGPSSSSTNVLTPVAPAPALYRPYFEPPPTSAAATSTVSDFVSLQPMTAPIPVPVIHPTAQQQHHHYQMALHHQQQQQQQQHHPHWQQLQPPPHHMAMSGNGGPLLGHHACPPFPPLPPHLLHQQQQLMMHRPPPPEHHHQQQQQQSTATSLSSILGSAMQDDYEQ